MLNPAWKFGAQQAKFYVPLLLIPVKENYAGNRTKQGFGGVWAWPRRTLMLTAAKVRKPPILPEVVATAAKTERPQQRQEGPLSYRLALGFGPDLDCWRGKQQVEPCLRGGRL